MVCLAYIGTAAGIYNLHPPRPQHQLSAHSHRHAHAAGGAALPFVFIPISTLNYVGVPPATKSNQISSLSNFARNLGGSAGTALLTTYLARNSQVHQVALAANVVSGSPAYNLFTDRIKEMMMKGGMSSAAAGQIAVGEAYRMMLRQASMLSYKNAFTILACAVVSLSPLPFLMRLPPKRVARSGANAPAAEPAPEELAVH